MPLDDSSGEWTEPLKRERRQWLSLPLVLWFVVFALFLVLAIAARAQTQPQGTPVLNQAVQARLLVGNTSFIPTRGLYIGDAVACNAAVTFAADNASVTLTNLQPGLTYPFSINKLASTGTTCASVFGLY